MSVRYAIHIWNNRVRSCNSSNSACSCICVQWLNGHHKCGFVNCLLCCCLLCKRIYIFIIEYSLFPCADLVNKSFIGMVEISPSQCCRVNAKSVRLSLSAIFFSSAPTLTPITGPASCHLIVVVQSPPQWGWIELARQISRGARPKGRPHCFGLFFRWAAR